MKITGIAGWFGLAVFLIAQLQSVHSICKLLSSLLRVLWGWSQLLTLRSSLVLHHAHPTVFFTDLAPSKDHKGYRFGICTWSSILDTRHPLFRKLQICVSRTCLLTFGFCNILVSRASRRNTALKTPLELLCEEEFEFLVPPIFKPSRYLSLSYTRVRPKSVHQLWLWRLLGKEIFLLKGNVA